MAYPGYRSYGTSGYKDAEQGESPVHTHAEVGVLATRVERTASYTAAPLEILGACGAVVAKRIRLVIRTADPDAGRGGLA